MTISALLQHLENLAPLAYQESYDNAGLIVGDSTADIKGVLVSLDCTEAVIDEAIQRQCNVVVAHHPIVFKGLKKITGRNYVERTIVKAIKHDIAIYATHTNLDNVFGGVNFKIAERLGLKNVRILSPKSEILMKLTVFVPNQNVGDVLDALHRAGAGSIGNYSHCSFSVEGIGAFKPNAAANPHLGKADVLEQVEETRIEVVLPAHSQHTVLNAMRQAHPYEEVAYYLQPLTNKDQTVGSGAVGELPEAMNEVEFLFMLKEKMDVEMIRHTNLLDKKITKVAICGGAGSFLLPQARAVQADVFVTADYKYHEFFDAEDKIVIADIGHYESEQFTKDLLKAHICKKFTNFAVHLSETRTNPVNYF